MLTFIMKTAAVLSLVFYLRVGLSIPLSKENDPKQIEKFVQSDSVPIALLLVVPPTLSQFRDDEEHTDGDLSFIEDQIVSLLLRDAEISFHEDRVRTGVSNEETVLFAEDLKALNPILRNDEDVEVSIVVEEPLIVNEGSDIEISPLLREEMELKENTLPVGPLPSTENVNLLVAHDKDFAVRLVPEESVPFTENAVLSLGNEGSLDKKLTSKDLPSERSYETEYASYKPEPKPAKQMVATYPEVSSSGALPILLNCAPKVIKGIFAEAAPSYRKSKGRTDLGEKSDESNSSDVLDLNSPSSIITMRQKRHETGVTHYKVSEDYPETFKGNHHLVSADYPTPNMIRITTHHE